MILLPIPTPLPIEESIVKSELRNIHELACFLEITPDTEITRNEVIKKIHQYIRINNLQDKNNKVDNINNQTNNKLNKEDIDALILVGQLYNFTFLLNVIIGRLALFASVTILSTETSRKSATLLIRLI